MRAALAPKKEAWDSTLGIIGHHLLYEKLMFNPIFNHIVFQEKNLKKSIFYMKTNTMCHIYPQHVPSFGRFTIGIGCKWGKRSGLSLK